ncbi:hypothetical protein CDL12_18727 [Handroanthus impetiginosus]|uniref:Uncharacterized protein n=1 Tax=Handroanthus impetiginosus TaxID=429701 RepID=A0A2G9GTT0_9LAMI|nr:hypothetical protein CDL12_18727 [Handroanthus impetiginosus]
MCRSIYVCFCCIFFLVWDWVSILVSIRLILMPFLAFPFRSIPLLRQIFKPFAVLDFTFSCDITD